MRITTSFVLFLLLFSCLFISLNGQTRYCSTDEKMEKYNTLHPLHKNNIKNSFEEFRSFRNNSLREGSSTTFVIPVHFIVVHRPRQPIGEGSNISEKVLQDQIDALNRDFNRENKDSVNTPSVFSRGGMNIVFCLAKIDPFGNSTNGISRYSTSLPFEANEKTIKESSGWSREDYLNIWITELDGKLGFSYIPSLTSLPDEILDGVVLDYRVVGNGTANRPYNLGRVAVHEVGHYLGLQHIFGMRGCTDDDGIEDTPRQDTAHTGCPRHPIASCGNTGDMFMNYMDYTSDSCKNAFTGMQAEYMTAILNGIRKSVTLSGRAPGCFKVAPLVITGSSARMPRCFGDKTASLEIFIQGGKAPYRYFLNEIEYATNVITGLSGGRYTVKVFDASGLVDSARYTIFEPDRLKINLEQFYYASCSKNTDSLTVKVNATGGLTGFMGYNFIHNNQSNRTGLYSKVPSGRQIFYVNDVNNCRDSLVLDIVPKKYLDTIPMIVKSPTCRGDKDGSIRLVNQDTSFQYFFDGKSITSGNITNLIPGNYNVRAINRSEGCVFEKNITLIDPAALTIDNVDIRQVPCFLPDTSKIIINARGGLGQLQYSIDSMNWRPSNLFEGVGTGIFDVRVRDGNGCIVKFNRTVAVTQVGGMFGIFEATDAFCNNNASGRVLLTATGGSGMYNYYLNGNQSSRDIRNLVPGSYNLTIEDRLSRCFQNKTVRIGVQPPMTVSIQQTLINPNNTVQIIFTVQGGIAPYLYSIDGGASFKSIPVFDQLPSGNYTITVLDNNNCRVDVPVKLTNSQKEEILPISCYPNPFTKKLQLELPANVAFPIEVLLMDNTGKMIEKYTSYNHNIILETPEHITTGLYLLHVRNKDFSRNIKIMKVD